MFAVLAVKSSGNRGILGVLLDRILRRRIFLKKKSVMGIEYSLITAYQTKRGLNWAKIERLCGSKYKYLVMPRDVRPPTDSVIQPFVPLRFYSYLVRNTAVEIIKKSRLQLYRRTVGVVDIEGEYQQTVLDLIRHCSAVRVLTADEQRYGDFCAQVMDTFGAPVITTADPHSLGSCVLIIAPDGVAAHQVEGLIVPVLSATDTEKPVSCPVLCDLKAEIPSYLSDAVPDGIEPTDFLGALFELGGMQGLSAVSADGGRCKGRNMSISEVIRYISG